MEKRNLKILLFFLLFCTVSANIQCGENGTVTTQEQQFSIARLSDEQINKQYEQIVREFRKSDKIHKGVQIGTYIVGVSAIIAMAYELLHSKATGAVSKNLKNYTPEQLIDIVRDLLERVRRLELGPNFLSWAYIKSWFYSLIWSPGTMLQASHFFLKIGDNYLNHVLYCANLAWFLGDKTKLGLLTKHEQPSTVGYEFAIGQLPKSIEDCATEIDGANSALLPVDVDYQRRHLAECCDMIIQELSKLLAFTKYVDTLSTSEKNHFENAKCARHLINYANSFCEKIEACLNDGSNEKLLPLVAALNTDLQATMIRFAESLP